MLTPPIDENQRGDDQGYRHHDGRAPPTHDQGIHAGSREREYGSRRDRTGKGSQNFDEL
jgi:hypothetical protein